jgi:hypothetical protein
VPLGHGAPGDLGALLDPAADDEERRVRVVLAQDVEDGRRRLRRPVVEAERDDPPVADVVARRENQLRRPFWSFPGLDRSFQTTRGQSPHV